MSRSAGSHPEREILAHPLVLRGAWLRVDAWYRSGNLAPEPELARWRLHPEAELRVLARELASGQWRPSLWLQVPYPKKGARLRHYVFPTVRDQVAFMAHLVLLGPLVDSRIHTFAFGNRWYRPIAWDRRRMSPCWVHRGYPLLTDRSYLPYARSHGLYRRVAHWTVARMTGAKTKEEDYEGHPQRPGDYEPGMLPWWVRQDWWGDSGRTEGRAYWATLDVQLAYPSIRLERLRDSLVEMVSNLPNGLCEHGEKALLAGYPRQVVISLNEADVRQGVAECLVDALQHVRIENAGIPRDAWRPYHAAPQLPPDKDGGLPTGLAVSGILLNAALHPTDEAVLRYLSSQEGDQRGAIVRFADDMIVLSRSPRGVLDLIEAVWRGLAGGSAARLDAPNPDSNLYLNLSKLAPEAMRKVVLEFLKARGWERCPECAELQPPDHAMWPETAGEWWTAYRNDESAASLVSGVERSAVGPGGLGSFVTTLVERLSNIARDTLGERFGEGARGRLAQLHDLARLDIDDLQVRADTRRAFAANRLVRAWLPQDPQAARDGLVDIRDSVAQVLRKTPWKFALWDPVVRAAARRAEGDDGASADEEAQAWLSRQLGMVAHAGSGRPGWGSWACLWPEEDGAEEPHARDCVWRALYLSFHRCMFWHTLAEVLRELWRHHDRIRRQDPDDTGPSPVWWTFRAVPEGQHDRVAAFLGGTDKWVRVLYPDGPPDLQGMPWELDELVGAALASVRRLDLAKGWTRAQCAGDVLMVPERLAWLEDNPLTAAVFREFGRLQPASGRRRLLTGAHLAQVGLAGEDARLGAFLFPPRGAPRVAAAMADGNHAVAIAGSLGCSECVGREVVMSLVPEPHATVARVSRDPFALWEYARARQILVGQGYVVTRGAPTLHRLLWGVAPAGSTLSGWGIRAWEVPSVGLTTRLGARLFVSALESETPIDWQAKHGPVTWHIYGCERLLSASRQHQLGFETGRSAEDDLRAGPQDPPAARVCPGWEVPPHAAYFVPFMCTCRPDEVDRDGYLLYCNVLLLVTAMDGGEAILDGLAEAGLGTVPFEDRWAWRSRIHLPLEAWGQVEDGLRWADAPGRDSSQIKVALSDALRAWVPPRVTLDDFTVERVDLRLDVPRDVEVARDPRTATSLEGSLPDSLRLDGEALSDDLIVRVAQVSAWADEMAMLARFPRVEARHALHVMQQVGAAFMTPGRSGDGRTVDVVVLPELCIPQPEVQTVRDLVAKTGRAALAGLYWRVLPPVYRRSAGSRPSRRWFVNEAELVIPVDRQDRGPPAVRWYRVRKPLPAHMEEGLAQALTGRSPGTKWGVLPGHRWYRFIHPRWGDFTIAICSDLLDPTPWRSMRGELLHLFMVAFNKDVDLYESLTWIRAYESYVNLVAVNHGRFGGSFLWTPRRRQDRELARLRGGGLDLIADVEIPVRELLREQVDGPHKAVQRAEGEWRRKRCDCEYKSPPPGYERRCLR